MLAPGSRENAGRATAGAERGAELPAQRRRPAGDAAVMRRRLRQAALQPGRDRGVRVRREPVRRHAGAFERRAGQRHHQVGDQHASPARSSGYFRDDRFNAKDFIVDRVLPYSNQQISTTFGGPIMQRPDPLLRQLRIRARAADVHLQTVRIRLQHRPYRHHAESTGRGSVSTIKCRRATV